MIFDINRPVATLSGGKTFSIVLTRDGLLYGCGSNKDGQLGLNNDQRIIISPVRIVFPTKNFVHRLGRGSGSHSIIITQTKQSIYTFGGGKNGALGNSDQVNRYEPTNIPLFNGIDVIRTFADVSHYLLLTKDRIMYYFGGNDVIIRHI